MEHAPDADAPRVEDLLAVARLYGPHGLEGEVKAKACIPAILDFRELMRGGGLFLRNEKHAAVKVRVIGVRPYREGYLLRFEGVVDRAAAEALRDGELCQAREQLPDLPEGWFWESDLIGLEVRDRRLGLVGRSAGLETMGERSSLRIEKTGGGAVLVPWVEALVPRVDLETGTIELDLPLEYPGLSETEG